MASLDHRLTEGECRRGREAGDSSERRELLNRFAALPEKERLAAYEEMRQYLAADLGEETDEDRLIQRKQGALEALEQVAAHLRANGELADDAAPTAKQFDRASKELGLPWDRNRINRVFGLWRNAKRTLLGEQISEGPAQKRFRLEQAGKARTHEDYFSALRLWLKADPEGISREDYDRWVKRENQARRKQAEKFLPKSSAIRHGLALPWATVIAIARGDIDLEEARKARVKELSDGLGDRDLVGQAVITAMFGHTSSQTLYYTDRGQFPRWVAEVGGSRAWFLGDLVVYRDQGRVRQRTDGEHQDQIMDTAEFVKRSGLSRNTVHSYIHRKLWSRLPEPDGQIGRHHHWSRNRVEKWLASRKKARAR